MRERGKIFQKTVGMWLLHRSKNGTVPAKE